LQNGGAISAENYFSTDKFMDRVHVSMDRPGVLGPPWTDGGTDRGGRGTVARAPELSLRPLRGAKARRRGRKRERGAQELGPGLTRAQAALWRPGDGGAEPRGGGAQ
jgi:hypothetical protein